MSVKEMRINKEDSSRIIELLLEFSRRIEEKKDER